MSAAYTQMDELDFQIADNWKLTVENESLREQNAALRQQLADAIESMGRVEERCAKLREQVKGIHSAYIGVVEKYEQSEQAIMDDYSGTTSYDRGMHRIKQECDGLRHRFDGTMVALGIEVDG